jgi:CrcB protein
MLRGVVARSVGGGRRRRDRRGRPLPGYVLAAHLLGVGFPYATLIVNVVGSFAMGALVETMALVWSTSTEMRLFLTTGVLGAFTTFSAFSLDFVVLFERRALALFALYTLASSAFSVGALFAGLHLMRRLLAPSL